VYYFTLRHYTFHHVNRICLLSVVIFSFAVPFVPISAKFDGTIAIVAQITENYYTDSTAGAIEEAEYIHVETGNTFPFAIIIYAIGSTFFAYRFIRSLLTLSRLRRNSTLEEVNGIRIRRIHTQTSFTFLNTIFIPYNENNITIIRHECAHVLQRHWIDLILIELVSIVLWFNPFIFLVKRALQLQHEFLADKYVLEHGVSFEEYAQCLIRNLKSISTPIHAISPLHSHSTKKRIVMMTKRRTPSYVLITYLLLIPTSVFVLMSFGQTQTETITPLSNVTVSRKTTADQTPRVAPVDLTKVTKIVVYGERIHPATKKLTKHTGVDFELPMSSDVFATADGVVVVQEYGDKEGNYIVIKHDDVYTTRYYHLEKFVVKSGDAVKQGQRIGLVGSTGIYSQGPHLHYEVIKNGMDVDPKEYLPQIAEQD
jgi:murein DD-endopeptidase MepM/ murein hydrolase activator NlpD